MRRLIVLPSPFLATQTSMGTGEDNNYFSFLLAGKISVRCAGSVKGARSARGGADP